jgi:PAS domain S-box-containing protein
MFGYAAATVIGQPLSILLPERFRMPHEEHLRRFGASGQSNRTMGTYGLIYGLRASGEEFPVEATVSQSGISHDKRFSVILRDITDRRQAEQVSEQLIRQLELLSTRLATAQEGERRKIAYALHDDLGQELATLKLYLQMMGKGSHGGQTKTPREHALSMATHATQRIHEMIADLDPPQLEDFGLDAAVREYCRVQTAAGGWNLHLDAPKPDVRAPRPVERACFRVAQEGLNNVLQHAQATEVWVHVRQDSNKLELVIRDNGIGFDRNAVREDELREDGSLGLFGMQIRAKHAGGSVEIKSALGGGTEVWAVFPLPAASVEPV